MIGKNIIVSDIYGKPHKAQVISDNYDNIMVVTVEIRDSFRDFPHYENRVVLKIPVKRGVYNLVGNY